MPGPESGAGGPASPLRGLAASLLGLAKVRIELAGLELRDEADRLLAALAFIAAAAVLGLLALGTLTALVVVAFWDGPRVAVLVVLGLAYAAGAYVAWRAGRREIAQTASAFETLAAELERDREALLR